MLMLHEVKRYLLQKGITSKLKFSNRNGVCNSNFLNSKKQKDIRLHSSFFKQSEIKDTHYDFKLSLTNENLLKKVDDLNNKINSYNEIELNSKETLSKQLKASWTYNSNAIEGNSLSLADVIFFLEEGLTVEGKPFKDYLAVRNHVKAIDFVYKIVSCNQIISSFLIKQINSLILLGINSSEIINLSEYLPDNRVAPGKYKQSPNYVLLSNGTLSKYIEPACIPEEMNKLFNWINSNFNKKHPVVIATVAHYNLTRIHPFVDGNGRTSRILMNLILMHKNFTPVIIKNERRKEYLTCLRKADNERDLNLFTGFIVNSLIETQELLLNQIEKLSLSECHLKELKNIK